MPARRALLGALLAAPGLARGEAAARHVWLLNAAGEEVALRYRLAESHDPAAMRRIRHLLRDLRAEEDGPEAPLLVDMLSVLQEGWHHMRPIRVLSGYRTARHNDALEGAAPASLHLVGWAADIEVPGLPLEFVAAACERLSGRLGFLGVGLYPRFVHLDIGPRRHWTRPRPG